MDASQANQYADIFNRYNDFASKFDPGKQKDHVELHFKAVDLVNSLLEHFQTLHEMEAALQLNCKEGKYDDRVLLQIILYSVGFAHPGFRKTISLMGQDARSEQPIILNSKARLSLAAIFPSSVHINSEWPKPKLWNDSVELNYSPDDYLLFHKDAALKQLTDAFFENLDHLEKMIDSFSSMTARNCALCFEHLQNLVAFHHMPLESPARLLSIKQWAPLDEALSRIEDLMGGSLYSIKNEKRFTVIDECIKLIQSLPHEDLPRIRDKMIEIYVAKSTFSVFSDENDQIAGSIYFIKQMKNFGIDLLDCVRAANTELTLLDNSALLIALIEKLPRVSKEGYCDDANACDLWQAAIIYSQNLDELLKLEMNTEAWLNLHVLIGDDRIRHKLHDHRHIESLLTHDLGL